MLKKVTLLCKAQDLEEINFAAEEILSIEDVDGCSGSETSNWLNEYISNFVGGKAEASDKQIEDIELEVVDCRNSTYDVIRIDFVGMICCGKRVSSNPKDEDYDEDFERIKFNHKIVNSMMEIDRIDFPDTTDDENQENVNDIYLKLQVNDIFNKETMSKIGTKTKIIGRRISLADSFVSEFMKRINALNVPEEELDLYNSFYQI